MSNKKLFTEFPPVATQDWEAVITKDLKGADYDKKLVWKTPEGIAVRPYYRSEDMKNIQHLNAAPA
ncbi:MAG: methylmalonyl-CoA mutase small subunit, partial [Bacteroidales bacterium]